MADAKITVQLLIEPMGEIGEDLPQAMVFETHYYARKPAFQFMEAELELILDRFYKGVKNKWHTGAGETFEKEWMSE